MVHIKCQTRGSRGAGHGQGRQWQCKRQLSPSKLVKLNANGQNELQMQTGNRARESKRCWELTLQVANAATTTTRGATRQVANHGMSACYSHRYSPCIHSINHYTFTIFTFVLRRLFTSFLFVYFICLYVYSPHTTVHTVTTICQVSHFVYIFSFYLNTSLNSGFCLPLRDTCNFATIRNAFVAQTETVSCFVSVAWHRSSGSRGSVALLRQLRSLRWLRHFVGSVVGTYTHTHAHTQAGARSLSQKPVFLFHSQLATPSGCGLSVSACSCRLPVNSGLTFVYVPPRRR